MSDDASGVISFGSLERDCAPSRGYSPSLISAKRCALSLYIFFPGERGNIEWGKVLFRPGDWDANYFPHVLARDADGDDNS
jgi:hypothetical protein